MIKNIFSAHSDYTGLILRLSLGLVVLPHGAQKLMGWFGGYGFTNTMHFFTETMHLPWLIGFAVIILETLGAMLLIAGFGSRIIGVLMAILMTGIIFSVHIENGFFMNWFGNQKGEGIEYCLLAIGLALSIVSNGAGIFSVDGLLSRQKREVKTYA
ncbi:DoxX family protein [Rhodocytophaga rosea]|uniref:DoxX family protein n=1 Tax=Rhodocytophaga rosea TaxID=2704465 RepID=A0A6C0GKJ7_9BACT|nr:DoxX family protein [Rhodocytophaga rosea]QHT68601.1 DoxX family protein [Rhodocytophaga rosea]